MITIPTEALTAYRLKTYRLLSGNRVTSKEEAIEFVNQRGFVFFWPIQNIEMPSLWTAVAGKRPVADAHDDPGHITWGWKDSLLGQRAWYYAKVLRQRATIISWELAPFFYALSENYGSPEEDYLTLYKQGRLTLEARQIFEALLQNGPIDTIALRKAAHLTSKDSNSRFSRALTDLQVDFKITPTGVAQVGAWNYAFIYAVTALHYPNLSEQARFIGEETARQKLIEWYLRSVGAARLRDITKLFGWQPVQVQNALNKLATSGKVETEGSIEGLPGEWFLTSAFLSVNK